MPFWGGGGTGGGGGGDLTQAAADLRYAQINMPQVDESSTSINLGLSHANKYIVTSNTGSITALVQKQVTVAWAAQTEIFIQQGAAGVVTLQPDTGVTLNSPGGLSTSGVGTVLSLKRTSQNTWTVGTPGRRGAAQKQMQFFLSNAGSVISAGYSSDVKIYGYDATIVRWILSGDDGANNGSIDLDIWKLAYHATNKPTVSNTIVASAHPTITTAKANRSSAPGVNTGLTGWTTSVSADDMFIVNVVSCSGFKFATLTLILE